MFLHLPLIDIFLPILKSPPASHQTERSLCMKMVVKIPTKFLRLSLSHEIEQQEWRHLPLRCHIHAQAYLRHVPIQVHIKFSSSVPTDGSYGLWEEIEWQEGRTLTNELMRFILSQLENGLFWQKVALQLFYSCTTQLTLLLSAMRSLAEFKASWCPVLELTEPWDKVNLFPYTQAQLFCDRKTKTDWGECISRY